MTDPTPAQPTPLKPPKPRTIVEYALVALLATGGGGLGLNITGKLDQVVTQLVKLETAFAVKDLQDKHQDEALEALSKRLDRLEQAKPAP